jgi:transcriptional regulator with XRE-family HTH domain
MIAAHLVEQIEQLLAEGKLSQRKIARLTGVSRGTIGAIASGRRQARPRRISLWEDELEVPDTPPQRCPGCGGMVYMPCRLCRTQKAIATMPALREQKLARLMQQIAPLGLNLKPVHQQRYEEVRRWRRLYALADKQPVSLFRHGQAAGYPPDRDKQQGTQKALVMNNSS